MEKTAKQFLKDIEREQDKFKLVNGLFIIQYINEEESIFIGDFLKSNSALNQGRTNKVLINPTGQQFNKNKGITKTGYSWKPLNIKFIEKPIKEILK